MARNQCVRRVQILAGGAALLTAFPGMAATLASDGTAANTQAQIDAANNGDVVLLPSSGTYTWSSDVTLPSSKAITLDLNGSHVTLTGSGVQFTVSSSNTGLGGVNRVTNGAVERGTGYNLYGGPFHIDDTEDGAGLRVDHITFTGDNVLVDING